jgi:uncharacterized protein
MSQALLASIQGDIKQGMISKDRLKTTTLRMLTAAIKQVQVDRGPDQRDQPLTDAEIMGIINKMIKQRRDAAQQFRDVGAEERAVQEETEITLLMVYLPEQLDEAAIDAAVAEAVSSTGAASMKDMGKVMGVLQSKLAGQADMGKVSALLKKHLTPGN